MNGSTVNICALDLTKAFDKMNHHGLFIKLMKRNKPVQLLAVIEYWFSSGYTYVKWASRVSSTTLVKQKNRFTDPLMQSLAELVELQRKMSQWNYLLTLLYATEVCPLNKIDIRALDYVVDSALKKIFYTNSKEIILECRLMFDLKSIGKAT